MQISIMALLGVVGISSLGAWFFSHAKQAEKPVKIMIFVGFFWLLSFIQLTVLALGYFIWHHYLFK